MTKPFPIHPAKSGLQAEIYMVNMISVDRTECVLFLKLNQYRQFECPPTGGCIENMLKVSKMTKPFPIHPAKKRAPEVPKGWYALIAIEERNFCTSMLTERFVFFVDLGK